MERVADTTKSAATFSIARKWIDDCTADHLLCNSSTEYQTYYPTRLLDCGDLQNSEEACRLIETNGMTPDGPYMTLSHCWGRDNCLKLTTSNYDQLLRSIPLSDLPRMYRDAVYITRRLGIRYLWIDSICIIQEGDQLVDWLREAKIMGQVYLNSFCNISAANAPGGDHSMFCSRDPDTLYPQMLDLVVAGCKSLYSVSDKSVWDTEVSEVLVNTRGWVLQERLLSRRILYFGERQIFWECRQKDASEIYSDSLPRDVIQPGHRLKNLALDSPTSDEILDNNFVSYSRWDQVVRAYTSCELSFPQDKLVALSAIAKVTRKVLRDTYVVGMWRRYLEFELLWFAIVPRDMPRSNEYRAPSWSWAAVNSEIVPGFRNITTSKLLIEVVDLKLEYSTDDDTSLVRDGWLRLRGTLKRLMLMRHRMFGASSDGPYDTWDMLIDGALVSRPTDSVYHGPQPRVYLDTRHDHFEEQHAKQSLFCIPAKVRDGGSGSIYVLILEVDDAKRGVYRRVGLARGWGEEIKEAMLNPSGKEDEFPCEEYREGLHTIRIV
jgi:hypothetical protein